MHNNVISPCCIGGIRCCDIVRLVYEQGRRNLGVGIGVAGPSSFAKCPFSGSKLPFSCVKNVIKIAFFALRALFKT